MRSCATVLGVAGALALTSGPVTAEMPQPVDDALAICLGAGAGLDARVAALIGAGWPVSEDLSPQGPLAAFLPSRVVLYDSLRPKTWDDARALRRLDRQAGNLAVPVPGGSLHMRDGLGVVEIGPSAVPGKIACELAVSGVTLGDVAAHLSAEPTGVTQFPAPDGAPYPFAFESAAFGSGGAVISVMDFAPEVFGGRDVPTQITTPPVAAP